jgi:hypothetical protein
MIPILTKEQFKEVYDQGFEPTFALFDALQQAFKTLEHRVTHLVRRYSPRTVITVASPTPQTDSNDRRRVCEKKAAGSLEVK